MVQLNGHDKRKRLFFFCSRLFASYPSGQKWAKQYALVNLKLKIEFDKKNEHNIAMPS